jgi:hypothetical protein
MGMNLISIWLLYYTIIYGAKRGATRLYKWGIGFTIIGLIAWTGGVLIGAEGIITPFNLAVSTGTFCVALSKVIEAPPVMSEKKQRLRARAFAAVGKKVP